MGKKQAAAEKRAKRIKKIVKLLTFDTDLTKKQRKALEAELETLGHAGETPKAKKPIKPIEEAKAIEAEKPKKRNADFDKHLRILAENAKKLNPKKTVDPKVRLDGESEVDYQWRMKDLQDKENGVAGKDLVEATEAVKKLESETDEEIRARVQAKRAARTTKEKPPTKAAEEEVIAEIVKVEKEQAKKASAIEKIEVNLPIKIEPEDEGLSVEDTLKAIETPAKVFVDIEGEGSVLVDPDAEQPRDRWGRPIIQPADGGKAVGYRRTTTFIDVLDDKSALSDWGRRVVVTGVAADAINQREKETELEKTLIARAVRANEKLAATAEKANKQLAKGKIDEDKHAEIHDGAEDLHKKEMNSIIEDAFEAGDGFVKAATGTRIHKLTEYIDRKEPLPDDVTESERRDLRAYEAAKVALNIEIIDVEQFVVIDELNVGGTLDRRLRYDSPKLGRRVTAIGDVKTGRVDFGAGKMTRQLAIYARGEEYDWRKPTERKKFRTNKEVALIFHLPAGKGVCEVYEIDIKHGWEGALLCKRIFEYRSASTNAKVFKSVAKVDQAAIEKETAK